ncbi:AMP-binding protein [Conexibacter sp. W3-3-2]|uniref:AMP-binding protein n=1 Tax=Conexibacter sp. W3-3-2 TaxID=2675227 RepID=UPI0012B7DA2F|nr:AMP-binding protein [Conexibacter sp. W3-3-2]MTD46618.1 AMP-binding protein [Conexibacter sp. W3-3-2]
MRLTPPTGPLGPLLGAGGTVARSGALRPVRPDRPLRAALAVRGAGGALASAAALGAALWAPRAALHDERGTLTQEELDADVRALAAALAVRLPAADARVGVLCRNHRGFVVAALAASRVGADLVPLNTDFAGPQLRAVLDREGVQLVVHDEEFAGLLDGFAGARVVAWHDGPVAGETVDDLLVEGAGLPAPRGARGSGRVVLLTSGTTGVPKGAPRTSSATPLALLAAAPAAVDLLARIRPVPRAGAPLLVAPPLNHMFGLAAMVAGLAAGSPLVLQRRFDPAAVLAALADHRVGVLCAVPTMLRRLVDVDDARPLPELRVVASGAAPLSPDLAGRVMDRFGAVLYNGYGSSEVGGVSLATPSDLRAAPGTVGRPVPGVRVRILDADGRAVPPGTTGRIFVGSTQLFEGYTGGGGRPVVDGLMGIGDLGHLDDEGRLFVDGRDDEMIVSGGENVFPQEVEATLAAHPAVADAAAVGVADEEFGQRLVAFVVLRGPVTEEALKDHVRAHLARYKVPRAITVVEALPRTATGKIRRAALPRD